MPKSRTWVRVFSWRPEGIRIGLHPCGAHIRLFFLSLRCACGNKRHAQTGQ